MESYCGYLQSHKRSSYETCSKDSNRTFNSSNYVTHEGELCLKTDISLVQLHSYLSKLFDFHLHFQTPHTFKTKYEDYKSVQECAYFLWDSCYIFAIAMHCCWTNANNWNAAAAIVVVCRIRHWQIWGIVVSAWKEEGSNGSAGDSEEWEQAWFREKMMGCKAGGCSW